MDKTKLRCPEKALKSFILDRAVGNTGLYSCNILPASDSQNATECNVYVKGLTSGCDPAKTRTMCGETDDRQPLASAEGGWEKRTYTNQNGYTRAYI